MQTLLLFVSLAFVSLSSASEGNTEKIDTAKIPLLGFMIDRYNGFSWFGFNPSFEGDYKGTKMTLKNIHHSKLEKLQGWCQYSSAYNKKVFPEFDTRQVGMIEHYYSNIPGDEARCEFQRKFKRDLSLSERGTFICQSTMNPDKFIAMAKAAKTAATENK